MRGCQFFRGVREKSSLVQRRAPVHAGFTVSDEADLDRARGDIARIRFAALRARMVDR
jgi:hypothetical protein